MAKYKDKSLMVKREERVPFWIRKTYKKILRRKSEKEIIPMFMYVDEAIADWLVKNGIKKIK